MQRSSLRALWLVCLSLVTLIVLSARPGEPVIFAGSASAGSDDTSGSLQILGKDGALAGSCPLRNTDVRGAISGFLARVTVTQTFANAAAQKIEAVYTFPLPENAAVDDMTIQIGDRMVRGVIRRREDARAIYEHARQTGHVAALLDQERPNIFTQAVTNIMPGEKVIVTISYLQTLDYDDGAYKFVFPMVVGPRYIPGEAIGKQGGGWAPDTNKVPDASKIAPPVTPQGTRAGHDISLELALDAGVPLLDLHSSSHAIDVARTGASTATIKLKNLSEIPNKDFILKYDVAGEQIADAVLSQAMPAKSKLAAGGYFSLILQPPARLPESDITPKELVFVLDTSGSMMGFPIEKAKELINHALDGLYPGDTFNLITFSGDTRILFPEPAYPTAENLRKAREVLNAQHGLGGTEMMNAIRAALTPSDSQDHMRIVCFATDGLVGNDLEIIGEVQKHPNARVFAYGIGNSVNRFLIEAMAKAGRGDSEVVTLKDNADAAAHRLYERLRAPVLTDLAIDWGNLPVTDVLPKQLPDLFSGKPLVVTGRYTSAATGTIRLRGKRAGDAFARDISVSFNSNAVSNSILASFWARSEVNDLMSQDWAGVQRGNLKPALKEAITQLGLSYGLMTQFTSFVAVEERTVTTGGVPQRVEVPVEMPEGVSYEGVFGDQVAYDAWNAINMRPARVSGGALVLKMAAPAVVNGNPGSGSGGGYASGVGGGAGGGVASGTFAGSIGGPIPAPPPAIPNVNAPHTEPAAADVPKQPTGERALLESKLSPSLLEAFDCWKTQAPDCKVAKDGSINVQLFLTENSPAALERLKALGFSVSQDQPKRKSISGKMPISKLAELATLDSVSFVAITQSLGTKQ